MNPRTSLFTKCLLLACFLFPACAKTSNQTKQPAATAPLPTPVRATAAPPAPRPVLPAEIVERLSRERIYVGEGNLWLNDWKPEKKSMYWQGWKGWNGLTIKAGMVFDLMDCAGYVGQARAVRRSDGVSSPTDPEESDVWDFEIVPGSMRKERIFNPCRSAEVAESDRPGMGFLAVYAVYPSRPERRGITIPRDLDLRAIYASLPAEEKQWRESLATTEETTVPIDLSVPDFWTDTDGDGKIDVISIAGKCGGDPNEDYTCTKILRLTADGWRQISFMPPC